MKVLQIGKLDPLMFYGGIETVAKTFASFHIRKSDAITSLFLGKSSYQKSDCFLGNIVILKKQFFMIRRLLWLILNINKFSLIYIHLPNLFSLLPVILLRVFKKNARLIVIYHSDIHKFTIVGKLYELFTKLLLIFVDEIVCSSTNFLKSSPVLPSFENKVKVIPFTCYQPPVELITKNPTEKYILMLARDTHYKGITFAMSALKNFSLKIKVLGIEKSDQYPFEFLGKVSEQEKWELIQSSQYVLMTSTSKAESYGISIVEAFSQNKTVVAADLGTGMNFLIGDNERGLLFCPENSAELLYSLERLTKEVGLKSKLETNSSKFFHQILDQKSFDKRLIKLLA